MRRIYVRVAGDNKYLKTLRPFVEAMAFRIQNWDANGNTDFIGITKREVCDLFNRTCGALYQLHQRDLRGTSPREPDISISEEDVMFDSEIDHFIRSGQWNNDGICADWRDSDSPAKVFPI